MQINLTGHQIEITDSIREYVEQKFTKLARFFEHINSVHVVVKVEKNDQTVEATLHVNAGEIHASCTEDNLYAAIDGLTDKLSRQLTKHKSKLNSH